MVAKLEIHISFFLKELYGSYSYFVEIHLGFVIVDEILSPVIVLTGTHTIEKDMVAQNCY